jgi:hypothetical protein
VNISSARRATAGLLGGLGAAVAINLVTLDLPSVVVFAAYRDPLWRNPLFTDLAPRTLTTFGAVVVAAAVVQTMRRFGWLLAAVVLLVGGSLWDHIRSADALLYVSATAGGLVLGGLAVAFAQPPATGTPWAGRVGTAIGVAAGLFTGLTLLDVWNRHATLFQLPRPWGATIAPGALCLVAALLTLIDDLRAGRVVSGRGQSVPRWWLPSVAALGAVVSVALFFLASRFGPAGSIWSQVARSDSRSYLMTGVAAVVAVILAAGALRFGPPGARWILVAFAASLVTVTASTSLIQARAATVVILGAGGAAAGALAQAAAGRLVPVDAVGLVVAGVGLTLASGAPDPSPANGTALAASLALVGTVAALAAGLVALGQAGAAGPGLAGATLLGLAAVVITFTTAETFPVTDPGSVRTLPIVAVLAVVVLATAGLFRLGRRRTAEPPGPPEADAPRPTPTDPVAAQ